MQPPLPSARASCPPALEGERRSVPLLPLSTLLPTQLSFQLLCSRESEPGQEAPSFFFFLSSFPPLPSYLASPRIPRNLHRLTCSEPARKFLPTPTLAFRAALLRLRESLPLAGASVQQHPGPFTSPHPSSRPGSPRPPCFAVVTASWAVLGLRYASGSAALAL